MARMRCARVAVGALLLAGTLSGCALDAVTAAGAGAALEQQAAEAGGRQLAEVKVVAARATLTQVAQAADIYATLNGGTTRGFAADLAATLPDVRAQLTTLSDTEATVAAGDGRCVSVTLPGGAPTERPC